MMPVGEIESVGLITIDELRDVVNDNSMTLVILCVGIVSREVTTVPSLVDPIPLSETLAVLSLTVVKTISDIRVAETIEPEVDKEALWISDTVSLTVPVIGDSIVVARVAVISEDTIADV